MNQDIGGTLFALGLVFFVLLIIFLICRELVCWYWKINKSVDLMEQILAELKESNGKIRNK